MNFDIFEHIFNDEAAIIVILQRRSYIFIFIYLFCKQIFDKKNYLIRLAIMTLLFVKKLQQLCKIIFIYFYFFLTFLIKAQGSPTE